MTQELRECKEGKRAWDKVPANMDTSCWPEEILEMVAPPTR